MSKLPPISAFLSLVALGVTISACGTPASDDVSRPADSDGAVDVPSMTMGQDSGVTSVFDGDAGIINSTDMGVAIDSGPDVAVVTDTGVAQDVAVVADTGIIVDTGPLDDGAIQCIAPDSTRCANQCVNTQSSLAHCGACNNACPIPANTNVTCSMGVCTNGSCLAGFGNCDGNGANGCETTFTNNVMACGACGVVCPGTANGVARCVMGGCGVECDAGYDRVGNRCIAIQITPRPIGPISLGDVTSRRPTLRWELTGGFDGAVVELCRDRACTMVIETLRVMGTSARPVNALAARSVVFWRLRGRIGAAESPRNGPTWLFHVPAVDATGGIDTSYHPHLDVNGDGFDDLAAGGPSGTRAGRTNTGYVNVYHSNAMGVGANPTTVLTGSAAMEFFGERMAEAGDVNGDGYGDLIVGSPYFDAGVRLQAGRIQVFLGGAMGLSMVPVNTIDGAAITDHFGIAVAAAGDVNRDGYADVVVGARDGSPGGRSAAGIAYVFHGSRAALMAVPSAVYQGVSSGDHLGWSVAGAGDVNADGFSDVIIGATDGDPAGRPNTGTASVYLGSAMGVGAVAHRELADDSAQSRDFGFSVASAGDVNGDGYSDVIVGDATAIVAGRNLNGLASIFHGGAMGLSMASARVLLGTATNWSFGNCVASAGDLNGDGFGDVVIGAPSATPNGRTGAGMAYVYHGSAMGVGAASARALEGVANSDQFGYSASALGDVNGDGFGDLVVGARIGAAAGRALAGTVSVYHGSVAGVPMAPTRLYEGAMANDYFGSSVASLQGTPRRLQRPSRWVFRSAMSAQWSVF